MIILRGCAESRKKRTNLYQKHLLPYLLKLNPIQSTVLTTFTTRTLNYMNIVYRGEEEVSDMFGFVLQQRHVKPFQSHR